MQLQKKILPLCCALLGAIFILSSCAQKPADLETELRKIPGVEFRKMEIDSEYFAEKFSIMLTQPLDHDDSSVGTFQQRMFLSHVDFDRPVVLITEGYAAGRNYMQELTEILKANQIRVEYRYFGKSSPDEIKWDYLNNHQASYDYHRIVSLFKKTYPGKWVSTG